ncbi:hypothetical protein A0J61_04313 [Choanephora cucurbitarum]|uniref:Protein Zds1 C-terminal domain-containing protein n=1 Tax=Choanephora cucurbitarum TaxID=101091 RepID=A0A1C7NK41_9FUNG|nr:hypothetical protein A0J61_04313 [Choanephora cucurbitarum]
MASSTLIPLPEIDIQTDDWDLLKSTKEELNTPPLTPTATSENNNKETAEQTGTLPSAGLTRALSLTRQLQPSKEEENVRKEVINILTSNPSHLFWVPASQHPEIAPAEFEKYVEAHGLMIRKKSTRRRQSVLSEYFTASDQQKMLESAPPIEQEIVDSFRQRRSVLRRSMSLQCLSSGGLGGTSEQKGASTRHVPDFLVFDRNSSPLDQSRALVPKGDRPLFRRGARTNFKRNSSLTPSSQHQIRPPLVQRKSESDYHLIEGVTLSDNTLKEEQKAIEEDDEEEDHQIRDLSIAVRKDSVSQEQESDSLQMMKITRSVSTSTATSTSHRKSSWSSWAFWSDERSSKKSNKVDPVSTDIPETKTSSPLSSPESAHSKRFTLSSLFSRNKSKQHHHQQQLQIDQVTAHLTAKDAAEKQAFQLNSNMTRLPLHVERAIYRLSHIKLANPRRPLHEQVLISNHMFWYLSVIANNKQNGPNETPIMASSDGSSQERKRPRKRLVKRPPPPPAASKNNGPNRASFIGLPKTSESTGFVVPDNYLNPKLASSSSSPSLVKKPTQATKRLYTNQAHPYRKKHTQQNDSSSSESDTSDDDSKQDDDVPLALYKQKHTNNDKS